MARRGRKKMPKHPDSVSAMGRKSRVCVTGLKVTGRKARRRKGGGTSVPIFGAGGGIIGKVIRTITNPPLVITDR